MGKLSANTIKKITLLYFVAKFHDGVYSHYRLQKTLYHAIRDSEVKPFKFTYTKHGQYSYNVKTTLSNLHELNYLDQVDINGKKPGKKWYFTGKINLEEVSQILGLFSKELMQNIDEFVERYGYLSGEELKQIAHEDPILIKASRGDILFDQNIDEWVDIDLPDEDCIDLELSLNPLFVENMTKLTRGIENGEISLEGFRRIA
jgi:hypothetical protein